MLNRSDAYPYQARAVEFGKAHENCALWKEPGLGKTFDGATVFADLLASYDARRLLVIAPLRVARKVWPDEIKSWSHLDGLQVATMTGSLEQRVKAMRTPADIHTLNLENVQWLEAQFLDGRRRLKRWPWDFVILDESQGFRNQSSQRWKALARLRPLFPRMLQLTGTPAPNGYGGLWSQAYLLDGGRRLGDAEWAFQAKYFTPPSGEFAKWNIRPTAKEEIQRKLSDIVLAMRTEDYLDLPPVVYNFVPVTLPRQALATYKRLEREFTAELRSGKMLTAVNSAALDGKLLQLANGAVYTDREGTWEEFHVEKLDALEELLDGIGKKALIVYYYQHDLARITARLEKQDRPWKVLRSDDSFERWAHGEYDYGVLHSKSAGHGLNDVYKGGAEHLIHVGLGNDLELYQQVNGRLTGGHRRKDRNVVVHHIVAEQTRDDDYVKLMKRKAYDQDDLMRSLSVRAQRAA